MAYMLTSDNIKIYFKIKGEGLPIIFIHGFSEDHNSFRVQEKGLSKKYKVITYDLRGHGKSYKGKKGLSLERLAKDLKELIEFLKLEYVTLVGWSMGTSIIFEYINIFNLEKLFKICIVDKSPKVINDKDWNLGLYHGEYTTEDGIKDLELIKNNWLIFSEKFIRNINPNLYDNEFKIAMKKMQSNSSYIMYCMWRSMIQKDYRDILKKINIPALIIFGEKSTLYSIKVGEYLESNIKDSELIIFKDSTHLLVLENPIKFNRVLEKFI